MELTPVSTESNLSPDQLFVQGTFSSGAYIADTSMVGNNDENLGSGIDMDLDAPLQIEDSDYQVAVPEILFTSSAEVWAVLKQHINESANDESDGTFFICHAFNF